MSSAQVSVASRPCTQAPTPVSEPLPPPTGAPSTPSRLPAQGPDLSLRLPGALGSQVSTQIPRRLQGLPQS